jgi:hypothetical protein
VWNASNGGALAGCFKGNGFFNVMQRAKKPLLMAEAFPGSWGVGLHLAAVKFHHQEFIDL